VLLTFTCFCLTLVVFRCPHLAGSWAMLGRMFTPAAGEGLPLQALGLYLTFAAVIAGHLLGQRDVGRRILERLPGPVGGLVFGAALTLAVVLAPGLSKAFIYFQF
jgi:hypothetical protein